MTEMPPYIIAKDEDSDSEQVDSEISADVDDWVLPLSYEDPRHTEPIKGEERVEHSWRLKEKYKTHCVALVLCLNVGVDPPDVVKTQPCARLECWMDPHSMSPNKALESIGGALQQQYERWQPRARYKQSLDPTSDEVKKLCCSLRRNAKDERVLFHYNGHGVPKPTSQGEIWVFNRAFTQYIPLSMYDLQTWMGAPSLYVYDCSNAGVIVDSFKLFADQHDKDYEMQVTSGRAEGSPPPPPVSYKACLQLGACAAGQALPMNPELPADLFTACLTTPVKMAMKWFVLRARTRVTPTNVHDLIDKIPGQVTDRRTMLGELNWIFTAITDTIAWNSLPTELFQQLFRADLLTASLCRNYLLADRIMRSYNCTPVSSPALPSLAGHPLWQAWDQTLDLALAQLPAMLSDARVYQHSPFFRDQLTAFQVWLDLGSVARPPPDQLPMVLQVLLSTLHRVRALQILCRFLALGGWAVRAVLAVGIFPYMLKLLQASAHDLRASMVYIWAKIIAHDPSCQVDLVVNAKGHKYFLAVLQDPTVDSEHRTLAAFVLAGIVDHYPAGQEAALQGSMISICLELVGEAPPLLLRWLLIALGRLWRGYDEARWAGVRDLAHEKLAPKLTHHDVEVRAACAFALGTFMSAGRGRARTEHANALDQQVAVQLQARAAVDASPLVRQEILAALQWMVLNFEQYFIALATQERLWRSDKEGRSRGNSSGRVDPGQDALASPGGGAARRGDSNMRKVPSHSNIAALTLPTYVGRNSVYSKLWVTFTTMCKDPHPGVSNMASDIVNYICNQMDSVGRDFEMVRSSSSGSSTSLPPSPNTHLAHLSGTRGHRRGRSVLPNTITEDSPPARDREHKDSLTSTGSAETIKKPIVQTQFVSWCAAMFARDEAGGAAPGVAAGGEWGEAGGERGAGERRRDDESRAHHERVWRYSRNKALRRQAKALSSTRVTRLETQAFHSRCPLPPSVILFHPYEQHAAVASKDNFGIWDWGTGAKLCVGAWRRGAGRITALAWLNAHHHALLAALSHQGHAHIYRPGPSSSEPALVSAWRALDVWPAAEYRPPPAQPLYSLAQLVSEQFLAGACSGGGQHDPARKRASAPDLSTGSVTSQYSGGPPPALLACSARLGSLAAAGHAPHVTLWDTRTEQRTAEINTECSEGVTALWRGASSQLICGFRAGGVTSWDLRAPAHPARALHHHAQAVLCVHAREDRYKLVTASMDGCVRIYDTRRDASAVLEVQAAGPLAAAVVHPMADLLACGSINQCISLYDLSGGALNTIKFHEGFMGARIGPVSCLAFHPLRCAMGVGAKDSTVSVYVSEARR